MARLGILRFTISALLVSSFLAQAPAHAEEKFVHKFYPAVTLAGSLVCKAIRRGDDARSALCDQILLGSAFAGLAEIGNTFTAAPLGWLIGQSSGQGDLAIPFVASANNQIGESFKNFLKDKHFSESEADQIKAATATGALALIASGLLGKNINGFWSGVLASSSFTFAHMLRESLREFVGPMTGSAILSTLAVAGMAYVFPAGTLIPLLAFTALLDAGVFAAEDTALKLAGILQPFVPYALAYLGTELYVTADIAQNSAGAHMQRVISKALFLPLAFTATFNYAKSLVSFI